MAHISTAVVVLGDERLYAYSPRLALGLALWRHDRNLARQAAQEWCEEGWTERTFHRALRQRSVVVGETATTTNGGSVRISTTAPVQESAAPRSVSFGSQDGDRSVAMTASSSLSLEALWRIYYRADATGQLLVTIAAARDVAHARWSPKRPSLDERAQREREHAEAEAERRAEAAYLEEAPIRIGRLIAEITGRDEEEIRLCRRKPRDVWDAALALMGDDDVSVSTIADALGTSRTAVYEQMRKTPRIKST